jgi:uncharacterized membrane protein
MDGHIALLCPTHHAAEEAARRLTSDAVRRVLPPRAVAVVWADREGRCHVRHGARQPGRRWALWLVMAVAVAYGGLPGVVLAELRDTAPPGRICDTVIEVVARRLAPGDAAVVVTLGDPTPLLLVEAVRHHVCGVVWSTLSHSDEELMATVLLTTPSE